MNSEEGAAKKTNQPVHPLLPRQQSAEEINRRDQALNPLPHLTTSPQTCHLIQQSWYLGKVNRALLAELQEKANILT